MSIFTRQFVTPKAAHDMLTKNRPTNRPIKEGVVAKYIIEMKEGRWKENTGEAIKFNTAGELIDGQHRLTALYRANMSFHFDFANNIEDEVIKVLDSGLPRSTVDNFAMAGVSNFNSLPSIIKLFYALRNGYRSSAGSITTAKVNLTTSKIFEIYNEQPVFWDEVAQNATNFYSRFHKTLAPSVLGAAYALFINCASQIKVNNFFEQLVTGNPAQGEAFNKAVNLLRYKLLKDKTDKRKMPIPEKHALIIKAWNLFIRNLDAKSLTFKENEEFPIPLTHSGVPLWVNKPVEKKK